MTVIIPARPDLKTEIDIRGQVWKRVWKRVRILKTGRHVHPHQEFPGGPRLGCWLLPDMFQDQWIIGVWGSTVKRIVYFKWVVQFKNITLNHFSTGPPIITEHTLQASEISESEAKLMVCTTSSVYCIARTGRIISPSLADKTNKD